MPDDQHEPGPQELEDLARRYVDLWQDQMSALAADPEFAESLHKMMAAMGVAASGLPAMLSAWPTAMAGMMAAARPHGQGPHDQGPHGQEPDGQSATGGSRGDSAGGSPNGAARQGGSAPRAPGAAAPAAASDGGGDDLGVLQERLAALEQRVRELEGRPGRARRGPKPKSQEN